jgi:hypothetical protein
LAGSSQGPLQVVSTLSARQTPEDIERFEILKALQKELNNRAAQATATVGLAGSFHGPLPVVSSLFAQQAQQEVEEAEIGNELQKLREEMAPKAEPRLDGFGQRLDSNPPVAQKWSAPDSRQQPSSPDVGVWVVVVGFVLAVFVGIAVLLRSAASAPSLGSSRIRIVATPPGDAPDHIRRAWIGLELPVANGQIGPCHQPALGILSGRDEGPCSGYAVDGRQAVGLLTAKAPEAAAWWREHAPHVTIHGYQLVFPADVCEQIGSALW